MSCLHLLKSQNDSETNIRQGKDLLPSNLLIAIQTDFIISTLKSKIGANGPWANICQRHCPVLFIVKEMPLFLFIGFPTL